jgi:hypothetical protein
MSITNKFFTVENRYFKFFNKSIGSKTYPWARPRTGGVINICKNFDWKNKGSIEEVPVIRATELELVYGSYTTSFLAFLEALGTISKKILGDSKSTGDVYPQLYATKETGFQYIFPSLMSTGNNLYHISNSWQAITSGPSTLINSFADGKSNKGSGFAEKSLEMAATFAIGMQTPGFGFDDMYNFSATSNRSITVSFPLYNTYSVESAYSNYSFINLFMFQNLKTRTSLATYIPPKLYIVDQMETHGGFYSPVCVVTNFSVESIGTTRKMVEFSNYSIPEILMPEAYKVSITFMELVQNSSNIFAGSIGGDKVTVTNADPTGTANGLLNNKTTSPVTPNPTPAPPAPPTPQPQPIDDSGRTFILQGGGESSRNNPPLPAPDNRNSNVLILGGPVVVK